MRVTVGGRHLTFANIVKSSPNCPERRFNYHKGFAAVALLKNENSFEYGDCPIFLTCAFRSIPCPPLPYSLAISASVDSFGSLQDSDQVVHGSPVPLRPNIKVASAPSSMKLGDSSGDQMLVLLVLVRIISQQLGHQCASVES